MEIASGLWKPFCRSFTGDSPSGYFVFRRDCYIRACCGEELAIKQWKAWELYLATAKIEGRI